jgi:signal peptidase I
MRISYLFAAVIEKALTAGATVRFRAEGTSMYPTIRDGEAITIAAICTNDIVRGDVLLCRHEQRLVAHRVVSVATRGSDRFFELRGDSKASCDMPVDMDAVVGRIIDVCRNGRLVTLSGRGARLRHVVRAAASHIKWLFMPTATVLFGVSSRPSP